VVRCHPRSARLQSLGRVLSRACCGSFPVKSQTAFFAGWSSSHSWLAGAGVGPGASLDRKTFLMPFGSCVSTGDMRVVVAGRHAGLRQGLGSGGVGPALPSPQRGNSLYRVSLGMLTRGFAIVLMAFIAFESSCAQLYFGKYQVSEPAQLPFTGRARRCLQCYAGAGRLPLAKAVLLRKDSTSIIEKYAYLVTVKRHLLSSLRVCPNNT